MSILNLDSLLSGSFISTILIGIFVYFLFIVTRFVISYRKTKIFFDSLPGYKPEQRHWLRGDLNLFFNEDGVRIDELFSLTKKFPKYFRLSAGPFKQSVLLVHPDSVKILYKTAEPKSVNFGGVYKHLKPWLGEGLLIAGGAKWARSRRLLTPAFHFDILKPYQAIYNRCSDILLSIIDKYAESGESFELFQLVSNCTLDIILQCAFSYNTDCQTERLHHPYCKAISEAARLSSRRSRSPLMFFDFLYKHSKNGKKFKKECDFIHGIADEVIDSRKKALEGGKTEVKKYLDFLDVILTAKDENGIGMTREDIRAEVDTFLFEGHDTTTSGIAWILYELAKNPDFQKSCQDEIDDVMKDNPQFITWENLSKFDFLAQCIKEGMRLHPPVPTTARHTTQELTIDGIIFPPGTNFVSSIYAVHHNPTVWPDPWTYYPGRFSKENNTTRDSFAFIPFAAGPRNCIGQHFAMNEEKTVISRILERFTLELDPQHKAEEQIAIVLRAKNGIKCFAKKRK